MPIGNTRSEKFYIKSNPLRRRESPRHDSPCRASRSSLLRPTHCASAKGFGDAGTKNAMAAIGQRALTVVGKRTMDELGKISGFLFVDRVAIAVEPEELEQQVAVYRALGFKNCMARRCWGPAHSAFRVSEIGQAFEYLKNMSFRLPTRSPERGRATPRCSSFIRGRRSRRRLAI